MNRARWDAWKQASGAVKDSIFSELVADNEPLVEKFASEFLRRSRAHREYIEEDIFQAARIGIMLAIKQWDPSKGAFSTIAFHCARYEMQTVVKNGAQPISLDRRALLPIRTLDRAAIFYARHGREPTPAELGVREKVIRTAQQAQPTYVPQAVATNLAMEDETAPEERIDRARDMRALKTFLSRYSSKDQRAFWSGKRPDLEEAAKTYVARRRGLRSTHSELDS